MHCFPHPCIEPLLFFHDFFFDCFFCSSVPREAIFSSFDCHLFFLLVPPNQLFLLQFASFPPVHRIFEMVFGRWVAMLILKLLFLPVSPHSLLPLRCPVPSTSFGLLDKFFVFLTTVCPHLPSARPSRHHPFPLLRSLLRKFQRIGLRNDLFFGSAQSPPPATLFLPAFPPSPPLEGLFPPPLSPFIFPCTQFSCVSPPPLVAPFEGPSLLPRFVLSSPSWIVPKNALMFPQGFLNPAFFLKRQKRRMNFPHEEVIFPSGWGCLF